MIRVAISVEGQTEDEFCKQVLAPFLRHDSIELTPVIVTTKREKCGMKHKGGCINLDRVRGEIKKLLPNFDYVTTFYDLYGFDIDETVNANELESKIHQLFDSNHKLIPYVQKYEFETLLFSKPEYFEKYFGKESAKTEIENIISTCGGVEEINNSPITAPSKRMDAFFEKYNENYDKNFHGPSIAEEIGLDAIMNKCNRFRAWIETIKALVA